MYDVQDFVYRWFGDVGQSSGGEDLRVNCPFCKTRYGKYDFKRKLYISTVKHTCHCFRCEYAASWVKLVMDVTGLNVVDAISELYVVPNPKDIGKVKVVLSQQARIVDESWYPPFYEKATLLSRCTTRQVAFADRAREYVLRRGFGTHLWDRYGLCITGSIPNRVIIPIEGDYWQARAIYPFIEPKYMGPKEFVVHDPIFNVGALQIYDEVVICEGAFSAMAVGYNAVALMGKVGLNTMSGRERRLCSSDVERFVVALDSDAYLYSVTLAERLMRAGKEVEIWRYMEGDPASSQVYSVQEVDLKTRVTARLFG